MLINPIDFKNAIQEMRRCTAYNKHTESYIIGSSLIEEPLLAKKFENILNIQELDGYIASSLATYRYSLYQEMIAYAKEKLSEKEFTLFYDSF